MSPILEPCLRARGQLTELRTADLRFASGEAAEFLALNTVKGHNRRIFDELQVQRRTEAMPRAGELGLL